MDECVSKQLCVISFLPHILDTGAAGRNEYIGLLKEMGNKYKQKSWGYSVSRTVLPWYYRVYADGCGLKVGLTQTWKKLLVWVVLAIQ